MGTVIGAIATGQVTADASHASLPAWTSATSLLTGFVFTGACGYLAAVYLVGEAARRGDGRLQAYFTRRAQAAGIVTGALSLATLASPALTRENAQTMIAVRAFLGAVVSVLGQVASDDRRFRGTGEQAEWPVDPQHRRAG